MRAWTAVFAIFVTLTPLLSGADKLTEQDRIELVRGLLAEYATVKQLLPRAKKALPFESTGSFDKKVWEAASREYGPAGRVGDLVHITKVFIESDKLVLQINGGFNGGLLAEYATVKQLLPRAKKALPFESTGSFDKKVWEAASREYEGQ